MKHGSESAFRNGKEKSYKERKEEMYYVRTQSDTTLDPWKYEREERIGKKERGQEK